VPQLGPVQVRVRGGTLGARYLRAVCIWNEIAACDFRVETAVPPIAPEARSCRSTFSISALATASCRTRKASRLPSRSAARDEALTAVRELARPKSGENGASRHWAGWFLEVADEKGKFVRMPIGHPALEVVRPGIQPFQEVQASPPPQTADTAALSPRAVTVATELSKRRQDTVELLEHSRRLHEDLSSLCLLSQNLIIRARSAVERARVIREADENLNPGGN
jgi:hypothetical protein